MPSESDIERLGFAIAHDPCRDGDRWPLGAVTCGADVRVRLRVDEVARPSVERVRVVVSEYGDQRTVDTSWQDGCFETWLGLQGGTHAARYQFEITCTDDTVLYYVPRADGRTTAGELSAQSVGERFQVSVYEPGFETPDWLAGAVMYQVFPDRFVRGKDGVAQDGVRYHERMGRPVHLRENWDEPLSWDDDTAYDPYEFAGGTLQGIREKLAYLQSLGVEVLYLNPVFEARSYHRYDTADYERIDPMLGTDDEFSALVAEAREHGISIVLDAVLSHTGSDSRYFNAAGAYASQGAAQGSDSPYYAWYDFTPHGQAPYRCWWGDPSLPEVNEHDGSWQAYVLGENGILRKWLAAGARGYRFDVADEVPDDVLARIRHTVKTTNPEACLIGEVWEDATTKVSYGQARTYALGTSLDSVMNYPLRDALLSFATGTSDAHQLATFLKLQQSNYPAPLYRCLMNLLSSHDVERVRSALALDVSLKELPRSEQVKAVASITPEQDARAARLQAMIAGLLYALPGSPCIYYGDERGMHGGTDPFCRAPMAWGSAPREDCGKDLFDVYRELGTMRKCSDTLKGGSMSCASIGTDALVVARVTAEETFIAVANRMPEQRTLAIDLARIGVHLGSMGQTRGTLQLGPLEDTLLQVSVPGESTCYAFVSQGE